MNIDISSIFNTLFKSRYAKCLKASLSLNNNNNKENNNDNKNNKDNSNNNNNQKSCKNRYLFELPFVFQFHRKHSFIFVVTIFLMVNYSQFHYEPIKCLATFNNKEVIREDFINVCLSYPFILEFNITKMESPPRFSQERDRIYILYYRWVHWIMFLISMIYGILGHITDLKLPEDLLIITHTYRYGDPINDDQKKKKKGDKNNARKNNQPPKISSKKIQQQKQQKEKEEKNEENEEGEEEEEVEGNSPYHNNNNDKKSEPGKLDRYFVAPNDVKPIRGWLWKIVYSLVAFLCVDVMIFFCLDYIFDYKFLLLPISSYPYERNVPNFSDYISRMFPPFVYCELEEIHELNNMRGDLFGCHLTHMELYEKVFFIFWFWLLFAILLTVFSLAKLFLYFSPIVKCSLWNQLKSKDNLIAYKFKHVLFRELSFYDIYFLSHCRNYLNREEFIILFLKYNKEKFS
nr:MAG: hypothetical protein [Porcellio scaber clopovirus]